VSHEPIAQPHWRDALRQQLPASVTAEVNELHCPDHRDHGFIGAAVRAGWCWQAVGSPSIIAGNKQHTHESPRREGSPIRMAILRLLYACGVKLESGAGGQNSTVDTTIFSPQDQKKAK
jgi:hypothetical protein